ncbi:MAG: hypothetical protein H0T14_05025 [Nocardioidaceae bacterium]|nr:hypothetical protein [Nocardioidaceae bacterium]
MAAIVNVAALGGVRVINGLALLTPELITGLLPTVVCHCLDPALKGPAHLEATRQ